MQCRHTVPDWHRFVDPAAGAVPVFAGCRLLVNEGEPVPDPRRIACAYWGHQRDCPLYDGPGAPTGRGSGAAGGPASRDVPVRVDAVWPVRGPGEADGMRLAMIGLGVLSSLLLLLAVGIGLSVLSGTRVPAGYVHLVLGAATLSVLTHILATLRTWARR